MPNEVKRYATRILLLHLGLLILVVSFVLGAAHQVRLSARDEAQEQSKERLQLLADLTARGLESEYTTILSDLYVILRDETATATATATTAATATAPASVPATQQTATRPQPGRPRGGLGVTPTAGGTGRPTGGRGRARGADSSIASISFPGRW
jgi:hypothetical protein